MILTRRTALTLALPAFAAACGGDRPRETTPPPFGSGPPSYGHLTPIRLDVAGIDFAPPDAGAATLVVQPAPIEPAQAMMTMARDRLVAAGTQGRARFAITTATLTRTREGAGGMFSAPTERISVVLDCRVEVLGGEGGQPLGFAQAATRRSAVGPAGNAAERSAAADRIMRQAMADLNIEFEYQVRRNLRRWLAVGAPGAPGGPAAPVESEDLPRTR